MSAVLLGGLAWEVWKGPPVEPEGVRPNGSRILPLPNTKLVTHDGQEVRFYDDLIRDKVVAINLMYRSCGGICPLATLNLLQVQRMLGERVGRDVFLYSITLQPELDSPRSLEQYATMYGVKPGWLFLTGAHADIRDLRYRLGFFDDDPVIDGAIETHTGMVRIGNDRYDRWTMAGALSSPEQILATINHVDRGVVRTGPAIARA